jgi:hypothetical protein
MRRTGRSARVKDSTRPSRIRRGRRAASRRLPSRPCAGLRRPTWRLSPVVAGPRPPALPSRHRKTPAGKQFHRGARMARRVPLERRDPEASLEIGITEHPSRPGAGKGVEVLPAPGRSKSHGLAGAHARDRHAPSAGRATGGGRAVARGPGREARATSAPTHARPRPRSDGSSSPRCPERFAFRDRS